MALPVTSVGSSQIIVTITITVGGPLGIKNNTYATDKGDQYVRIVEVKPNSPADIAGIKVGDIPVLYEGDKIMNWIPPGDFLKMKMNKALLRCSDTLTFSVIRNKEVIILFIQYVIITKNVSVILNTNVCSSPLFFYNRWLIRVEVHQLLLSVMRVEVHLLLLNCQIFISISLIVIFHHPLRSRDLLRLIW